MSWHPLARLDREFVWHPFTQMRDWSRTEPRVIVSGRGAVLRDAHGREYLDANASIWTNLHGHAHPRLNAALRRQMEKVSHCSALGLANEPASLLARELIRAANRRGLAGPALEKVFYSDNGSTALEVALKLAWEFTRRTRGDRRPRFLSLEGAYHGDTIGAVALGHIDLFHAAYGGLLFSTDKVMAPYCYRCPFNRAEPERRDARLGRKCGWECLGAVERTLTSARAKGRLYAAMVVEPRMQGAAGMIPQPEGWLARTAELVRAHGALLVADEVMTGFGRTGAGPGRRPRWFASHHESVQPDFLCVAKGLTGGYLPMAATLTTRAVFEAFLGEYSDFRTFFHGHSFTANPLGAAAALASVAMLHERRSITRRSALEAEFEEGLEALWEDPAVGDVRREGLVAGIELVRNWRTREPFDPGERMGHRVCEAMAARGVLTRPVGNVIVLMPPYCTTRRQVRRILGALGDSLEEVLGPRRSRAGAARAQRRR